MTAKPWIVHVLWEGAPNVRFSKSTRLVILRPCSDDIQEDTDFTPIRIEDAKSALPKDIFQSVMDAMPARNVVSGRLSDPALYPKKPGAVLFDTRNVEARKSITEGLSRLLKPSKFDFVPDKEPLVKRSLRYSALVAYFIKTLYERLMTMNGMDENDLQIKKCLLKVAFHGKETAPAFARMKLTNARFYRADAYYLIGVPVLGGVLIGKEDSSAEKSAKDMGRVQHYWYALERWAVRNAKAFLTVSPSASYAIAAWSQYDRDPDNEAFFIKKKCKDIKIELCTAQ